MSRPALSRPALSRPGFRVRGVSSRRCSLRSRVGGFWFGLGEALLLPLLFVALGLGWYGALARAEPLSGSYPGFMTQGEETWLIDGFNVVQVALLAGRDRSSWWSGPQRAELLARAEGFEQPGVPVLVVFDGARPVEPDAVGRVRSVFAPSADDWLVDRVRAAEAPDRVIVVTADRRLAGRVRHHGARVVSPREFLDRCPPTRERGQMTTL